MTSRHARITQTTVSVVIYVRLSVDKTGEGAAVARQEASGRLLAKAKGWKVVRVYCDNDASATSNKKRPEFEQLVLDIRAGEVQAVICWHLDRLVRKMSDLVRVIEAGQGAGLNIATVHGVSLDLGDPTGVAVAQILTAIAGMEVAHKGNRQRAANRQSAAKGEPPAIRAFGYEQKGAIREAEAVVVREIYSRFLAGTAINRLVTEFRERDIRNTRGGHWGHMGIRQTIQNPRYIAERWTGHREGTAWVPDYVGAGNWLPLVSVEVFRAANAKLNDPQRKKYAKGPAKVHLGSGLFRCAVCGEFMKTNYQQASVRQPDGTRAHRRVYVCKSNSGHLLRDADSVDEYVRTVVGLYLNDRDNGLAELIAGDQHSDEVAALRDEENKLSAVLAGVPTAIRLGQITFGQAKELTDDTTEALADIAARIAEFGRGNVLTPLATAPDPSAYWLDKLNTDVGTAQVLTAALCPGGVVLHRGARGRAPFDPATVTVGLPQRAEVRASAAG